MTRSERLLERKKARERMAKRRAEMTQKEVERQKAIDRNRKYECTLKEVGKPDIEKNLDKHQQDFAHFQRSITWYTCEICKRKQLVFASDKKPCKNCHLLSAENSMDPTPVP